MKIECKCQCGSWFKAEGTNDLAEFFWKNWVQHHQYCKGNEDIPYVGPSKTTDKSVFQRMADVENFIEQNEKGDNPPPKGEKETK